MTPRTDSITASRAALALSLLPDITWVKVPCMLVARGVPAAMVSLVLLALAPPVHGEVVECPKFYPWEDTLLAEVPYRHQGKGVVKKGRLLGATAYTGEFNGQVELQGTRKDVKGGFDVQFGFAPGESKWLVCTYGGGDIAWWEQLDRKVTSCKLSVRDAGADPLDIRMTCK